MRYSAQTGGNLKDLFREVFGEIGEAGDTTFAGLLRPVEEFFGSIEGAAARVGGIVDEFFGNLFTGGKGAFKGMVGELSSTQAKAAA